MKKTLIAGFIVALSIMFITPAMAFLDDNSTNAGASVSDVSAGASSGGNIQDNSDNSVYNGSKIPDPIRHFAPAGEVNYPGMPGRFDAPPERFGYMNGLTVQDLLEYDDEGLTVDDAIAMAKGVGGKRVLLRAKYGKVDKELRLDTNLPMPVFYKKQDNARSLGVIVIVSDSKKAISADVFAEAQVKAWELGGTALHVKMQGFQREVHTSGKGIGFTWTTAIISGGEGGSTTAGTGVIGAGMSWGQAGYYDHPFIIVHVLAAKVAPAAE